MKRFAVCALVAFACAYVGGANACRLSVDVARVQVSADADLLTLVVANSDQSECTAVVATVALPVGTQFGLDGGGLVGSVGPQLPVACTEYAEATRTVWACAVERLAAGGTVTRTRTVLFPAATRSGCVAVGASAAGPAGAKLLVKQEGVAACTK